MNVNKADTRRLLKQLAYVRGTHGNVPIQTLMTLLAVSVNDGESQQTIQVDTNQGRASNSRNVSYWSNWTRKHVPGPDYVTLTPDPYERRRNLLSISEKGKAFLNDLFSL